MKVIGYVFFMILTFQASSQTRLISHKSHSGSVQDFRPREANGNFGIVEITKEIKPDKKSSYKLIESQEMNKVRLVLFQTNQSEIQANRCMANDKIIDSFKINLAKKENRKIYKEIREKYIEQLDLLRGTE